MQIQSVEITNVKGIDHQLFRIDLIPNKPNILVAPNGYGKSSFAIAFESLKTNKIELDVKNYYLNRQTNRPELKIEVKEGANVRTLIANDTTNTIVNEFDIFVINSQLTAKATLLKFQGKSIAKPSMEIEATILIPTIPSKINFGYNFVATKRAFGINGKILPDITDLLKHNFALQKISSTIDFTKFSQVKVSNALNSTFNDIKTQQGKAQQVRDWVLANKLTELKAISEFNNLACAIEQSNIPNLNNELDYFLAAFQIIELQKVLGVNFGKAIKYVNYLSEKDEYTQIIKSVNSTRINIIPKEDPRRGLIVEWPKAHEISNGQRDVLSFITLLLRARKSLKKRNCILVIDEIFDYLDDANLVSFQYFITNFIEDMKSKGKNLFPILLTHLDPIYFNHFCFNKHKLKVFYLKDISFHSNPNMTNLIRCRENIAIKDNVDKYHFHYHPSHINISTDFNNLGLLSNWGESQIFHQFIDNEMTKYHANQVNYDPLAICFGVRIKIEKLIYDIIVDPIQKQDFIDEHGTKKKLAYCESKGINIPEIYYLLGIIYNDNLHFHNHDVRKPLAIKLENLTIKKLIQELFV